MILKGKIKAAFIYSILPPGLKSLVTDSLHDMLLGKLDRGLQDIKTLTLKEKNSVYRDFISNLNKINSSRESLLNRSLLTSLTVMSLLVVITFTVGLIKYGSPDKIIRFIELVLNNGGFHLIILPYLSGYLYSYSNENPVKLVMRSGNYPVDLGLSLLTGVFITIPVLASIKMVPHSGFYNALEIFTLIVSLTAVPFVEEIVFRYLIFLRGGKKSGYIISGLFSSLLFSAVHAPDSGIQFAAYFSAGILLCAVTYYRRSIFPVFLAHLVSNLLLNVLQ